MTAVEVLPWDAPREEWLQARHAGIGSSDIAILLGLSNWDSPFSLYHRKIGSLGEQEELERMRWGRKLEAVIADEFAERHPEFRLVRCGLMRNVNRPYQQATPDRVLCEGSAVEPVGIVEVKTDESFDEWGPDGSDEIPLKYRAQVIWQADCLDLPGVHVAALLPSKRYREYYVAYDPLDAKVMRTRAVLFLAAVEAGNPPPVDGSDATLHALRILHADLDDTEAQVPNGLAESYRRAVRAARKADAHKRAVEAKLRDRMGRCRVAVDRRGDKVATRSIYTVKEHVRAESTVDKLTIPRETT